MAVARGFRAFFDRRLDDLGANVCLINQRYDGFRDITFLATGQASEHSRSATIASNGCGESCLTTCAFGGELS